MQNVEKRFPDDLDLNGQFLEMVNFVYRDETLKSSELARLWQYSFNWPLTYVGTYLLSITGIFHQFLDLLFPSHNLILFFRSVALAAWTITFAKQ